MFNRTVDDDAVDGSTDNSNSNNKDVPLLSPPHALNVFIPLVDLTPGMLSQLPLLSIMLFLKFYLTIHVLTVSGHEMLC